ncbi:hypothetical protein X915_gp051 [Bacillus phage vB_BanS-Tsamsa]|uniref:Uncharacterized protein n=1 Tax=Bacillus phage vB_BanS-Tsamsa TaxID=1308863 RepID=U5J9I2_9CAUD|nr:hypothetical protein X915_gp051 [Bacillus phage vB_BanS-Tsamsa]AGI11932.1 hypothetical protein [Bacillus phage vB_BanS-Tsamsa]UUV46877.1 hypothetical protein [Bacillus phage vB_BanS-Thrax4]
MRPSGKFVYLLSTIEGAFIAEVVSGVKLQKGDELNYKGNKLFVTSINVVGGDGTNILNVVKIGSAIIIE